MLTVVLWTVVGVIGVYAAFNLGVLKGRNQHTTEQKALLGSATDSELVRAIREGELGVEDLREAGFDRVVEHTTKDNQNEGLQHLVQLFREVPSISEPSAAPEYKWRPIPVKRNRPPELLKDAIKGEEFWIDPSDLHYDKEGRVHIWHAVDLKTSSNINAFARVRILERGVFEVAVPCGAGGFFSNTLVSEPSLYFEVYRVLKYANTRWGGGDPLKRFKNLSDSERALLKEGRGPCAYVVPFYPEDTSVD